MFRGINNATLDAKGRMALPTRHRDALSGVAEGRVVLTIDLRDRCLLLYPLNEWDVVQDKLESLSNINPDARLLQRLLIGHATDLELDANGRILIPAILRDYAELSKKLVLVGQGNKIEVWSQEHWQTSLDTWIGPDREQLLSDADAFTGLSV